MSDDAQVTCRISGYQLELSDLRRLVSETSLWPDDCYVDVVHAPTDEIAVRELGQDRRKAAAKKAAPSVATKKVAS